MSKHVPGAADAADKGGCWPCCRREYSTATPPYVKTHGQATLGRAETAEAWVGGRSAHGRGGASRAGGGVTVGSGLRSCARRANKEATSSICGRYFLSRVSCIFWGLCVGREDASRGLPRALRCGSGSWDVDRRFEYVVGWRDERCR